MGRNVAITLPVLALAIAGGGCWRSRQKAEPGVPAEADRLRSALTHDPAPRAFYGHRLEPRESIVLHGAGQSDGSSFAAYTAAVAPARPMLSMSYIDLRSDMPAYFAKLRAELAHYPDLIIPQIGLSLNADAAQKHYEAQVARGTDDASLKQLCEGLRSLDRPVFLRIGYEFNGPWNGYTPVTYAAAFRHVAESIRACGLKNVAIVWDWSAGAELDAEAGGAAPESASARYMAFYPGDASVDWWAFNVFGAPDLSSKATAAFVADAARHRMPVMIAESTPKGHSVSEGQRLVAAWYAPYFGLIRSTPGIKAFCYIDWDWSVYPQWADWGDARIEDNAEVLKFYGAEVAHSFYADSRKRAQTLTLLRAQ